MLPIIYWLATTAFIASGTPLIPPVAKTDPKVDTVHGEERVDNYFWLREKSNPEVIKYLKAENRYTQAMMKHTKGFQEELYTELLARNKENDSTVPEKIGDYYYYTRAKRGKQYSIYCRKKRSLEAKEEILLDKNALAKGHEYLGIGAHKISPNHQLLAYTTDTTGEESYTLYVKDLRTGQLLGNPIPNICSNVEWANDNETLFYTTMDAAKRPYKLHRHQLGSDPAADPLIYHETDESFFLDVSKTRSKVYLLIELGNMNTSEVHYLNADWPTDDFKVIAPRQSELEYFVEHHGDQFFIATNADAVNFKLMRASITNPSMENWEEVIPHREAVRLDSITAFQNHLVISEREDGVQKIRVRNLTTDEEYVVDFLEPVYTVRPGRNPEFNTNIFRFSYTSFITPRSVFDYEMDTKVRELKKQRKILGGYDPSLYKSERIFAQAEDGTSIPISLVYKKGLIKNGGSPLLLYGYGSYGINSEPNFASHRLSLLDRGFGYAIAHIRGGEELGRAWYENGKLLHKRNTFTDFIACADHLIAEKYTASDKLVIQGYSAGGLLVGAVTNMRPELFEIVIAKVPFVDVVNTMLDESIPLTVIEYDEWGDPNEKKFYDYIKSYSPYDNIEAKEYPHILVTAGLNDTRVHYWEPAKWTAKLRALKTGDNRLLLKTDMSAGHGGPSGRYDYWREIAFEYAFVFDLLGIGK